ncbi:MAG: BatA and WFA domain-containing protein [Acidobacteriaceae bacterium]|nr:BatA and WFA domain-containing protein [Acidobacteriaceae bacterium]
MGFLSPFFLAGLAVAGLPLWLHLLRQFQRNPQPFSSLMFFERRVQSSVRHRRLRYLALLALRLAVIVLLALAFADPYVNETASAAKRRTLTVVAVDHSFSMRSGNRLENAKSQAQRIVDALPARSLAEVVALDSHIETLTQPEMDHALLKAAVQSIGPTDNTTSYGEFTRALRVMEQSSGMQLSVHLVSDMQQSGMPASFRDLQLGSHTSLSLHPIGPANAPNWAVESVTTPAHVYDAKRNRLTAIVSGWKTAASTRKLSLYLDGRVVDSKAVNVAANGRGQVEFVGFDVGYGSHKGEVKIDSADSLPRDDTFSFSVERSDPRRVLFLYARGRSEGALYYKAAIESTPNTGLVVQTQPIEQASRTDFTHYAYVVLNDVGDLEDALARSLCSYVSHGGGVLVVLGSASAGSGRVPLSSDRFNDFRQVQGAGYVDNQSPALLGVGRFENVQFLRAARLAPKADARVLARLADGSPLVIDEPMGEGRVLIFASSIDNSTNDFPLHSSYVPFAVQTGHYLAGTEGVPSSVPVGTAITLRRDRDRGTAADVIGPDGRHELSLAEASSAAAYELRRSGFYDIQRPNGQRLLVAANADRRESDLTTVPSETLDLWRNTGSTTSSAESASVERRTQARSLWQVMMILLLVTALVESIFGTRYLRGETQKV